MEREMGSEKERARERDMGETHTDKRTERKKRENPMSSRV